MASLAGQIKPRDLLPEKIGSLGVENAMKVINGESVEENIPVEVKLVTEENVSEFTE